MKPLDELENFASSKWGVATSLFSLIKLEARLAGLSIVPLLLNLFMLFIVLITVWLAAMVLLGYGVMQFSNNGFIAISSILLINIVVFALLIKFVLSNLKNMSFEKTRNYFSRNQEDDDNDDEKTNNYGNSSNGEEVTASTESGR